ncbi:MAG TPA: 23S rRNA (pseudouridine(1915)-N(3))-methyltransferase RlmH [Verrucomicrobiae bacterium]|nr:23S rRNA (pseudouridine(1915)-N(3))-methyltransferase RlmH [Verrucomicrobiae bacterium]
MAIEIISVGKPHDSVFKDAIFRYEKRLQKPFTLKWSLIPPSSHAATRAVEEESERIVRRLAPKAIVILLDERGQQLDSPALARQLEVYLLRGQPIVFIIGGAYGVSDAVRQRADFTWALSKLVFPHQIVRLLLVEQLYRAQSILKNQAYHHQ